MKGMFAKAFCGTLVLSSLFGVMNVNAYEYDTTSVFRAKYQEGGQEKSAYLRNGFRLCVKSDLLQDHFVYIWNGSSKVAEHEWPGIQMSNAGEYGLYCYTYNGVDDKHYDYVIFNDGSSQHQTIDLSVVDDSSRLVNSLAYSFGENDRIESNGRYVGRWIVNDTSALVAMVAEAKGLNPAGYTIDSYNAVLAALGSDVAVEDVTPENQGQYVLEADYISKLNIGNDVLNKLYVTYDETTGIYSSQYLDVYNTLGMAMNNLVERKDIVVSDNIQNGQVTAAYQADKDNVVDINVAANTGYETSALTVTKILSYDESGNPVFGDTEDIAVVSGQNNYNYSFDYDAFEGVGLYINATFKRKAYNIVFVVGENGEIKTLEGENIESPVMVYYGDDYSLKIVAKEGYEIDTIVVNGVEYTMIDGVLTLENITADTTVEISFTPEEEDEPEEEDTPEEEQEIVVPNTGAETGASEVTKVSLIGCISVGIILSLAVVMPNYKKIQKHLKK